MKFYYCEQRSKQWYDLRCGKLTASNFRCMLGNSWTSHSYILDKAMERLTGKCLQQRFWSEDLQRGIDLEPQACSVYENITGNKVSHVGFVEMDEYTGSSPDGLIGPDGLLETKCPNEKNYWNFKKTLKICPQHYTQMQFNMLVCNRKWCDYNVYSTVEPERPIIVRINRNEEYINIIINRLKEVNILIDRYGKKLYHTIQTKSLKFKKIGVMSGFKPL